MNIKQLRASLLLLLTAAIWGVSFVSQRSVVGHVEPFTFNASRCLIGAVALLPVSFMQLRRERRDYGDGFRLRFRNLLIGGALCGVLLFLATNFQQFGIEETESGKSAFITALYIVLVPVFGLFRKRIPKPLCWAGIALCVTGLYLLCVKQGLSLRPADGMLMLCALFFTGQILVIDSYAPRVNCIALSCIQFFISALLSGVFMLATEAPSMPGIMSVAPAILYSGLISSGLAYTLQIIGQRDSDPTVASLIMCLESVFALLAGFVLLGETPSLREGIGCALMLAGIVLSELSGAPSAREISSSPQGKRA